MNEKLHCPRPFLVQGKAFEQKKILFIYTDRDVERRAVFVWLTASFAAE
jgi:hypothetical protein